MGVHGIGRALELFEVEFEAKRGGGLGNALVHLLRALEAAELGDAVFAAIDAFGRHVGVELEGMPHRGEAELLLRQERHRPFELAFADVAPGANGIGNDVDAACGRDGIHLTVLSVVMG